MTVNAPIVLGNSQTWINNAGNTLTINGAVSGGANSLTINGNGAVVLNNGCTYTGGTTVNGGTLSLNYNHGDDGTPTIHGVLNINPGAMVLLNCNDAVGYNGGCVPTVNIVGGIITSNGINAYTTNFYLTGGTIASNGGNQYDFTNGYGITTYASTATSLINAPIACRDGNNLQFNVARGTTPSGVDLLVSGQLTTWGGGSITKNGPGLMELTNVSNNYSVATYISAGTLQLGDGVSNNGAVATNIANSATLTFANPLPQTFSYAISGAGNVVVAGPGTLTLAGTNTYSGTTTINGGNLAYSSSSAMAGSILINAGGALNVAGPYTTIAGWLGSGAISTSSSGVLALAGGTNVETSPWEATAASGLGRPPGELRSAERWPWAVRPTTSAAAAAP